MQQTLNYEILSEEFFVDYDYGETYIFEIEINDKRLTETKTFTIAFQQQGGVWFTAGRFGYEADESEQLINFGIEIAQNLEDAESFGFDIIADLAERIEH